MIDGVEVHVFRCGYSNRMNHFRRLVVFAAFMWAACWRVLRIKCDIVFATSTPLTIAVPGVVAKRVHGVPLIMEIRDLWPEVPIAMGVIRGRLTRVVATGLARWAYRHAAHIVALSPGMARGVALQGVSVECITVIPNAADTQLFSSAKDGITRECVGLPWGGSGPVILYAGTLGRVNAVSYLVRVAGHLKQIAPDVRVVIMGDGCEMDDLLRLARDLDVLNANLVIRPPVPKRELPSWYRLAAIALSLCDDVPALWDNSANKFFDALAAGRPIAINHEGWQADILRESGAGLVLPAQDTGSAAKMLSEFLHSPEARARASKAARRLGQVEYDRDILATRLAEVIEKCGEG